MVKFQPTMGGFDVFVDGELFGRLCRNHGFYTDSTVVKKFLVVSSKDLIKISKKTDEVRESMKNLSKKEHDVRLDYPGLNPRPRFTCYTEGCDGATLIRQPYMTFAEWEKATEEFADKHPCLEVKNEGWRG